MKYKFIILVLVTITFNLLFTAEEKSEEKSGHKFFGIVFPFYSPETRLGGVAVTNLLWYSQSSNSRPNSLMNSSLYTQNNQLTGELMTDIWWRQESRNHKLYLSYVDFPFSFYGIGNDNSEESEESFTSRRFELRTSITHLYESGLFWGGKFEIQDFEITDIEENGELATGKIRGSGGGRSAGLGMMTGYDSRDNIYYPYEGVLAEFTYLSFNKFIGSDYNFDTVICDLRYYHQIVRGQVLAFQSYYKGTYGEVPFTMLAKLGGRETMRGYFEGQLRDETYLSCQAEYRLLPVWWRFGLAGFGGFGQVAGDDDKIALSELRFFYGMGIRFQFNPEERMNVRIDYGVGEDSTGLYLTVSEAF